MYRLPPCLSHHLLLLLILLRLLLLNLQTLQQQQRRRRRQLMRVLSQPLPRQSMHPHLHVHPHPHHRAAATQAQARRQQRLLQAAVTLRLKPPLYLDCLCMLSIASGTRRHYLSQQQGYCPHVLRIQSFLKNRVIPRHCNHMRP